MSRYYSESVMHGRSVSLTLTIVNLLMFGLPPSIDLSIEGSCRRKRCPHSIGIGCFDTIGMPCLDLSGILSDNSSVPQQAIYFIEVISEVNFCVYYI
jgi:hypothetical protein